MQMLKSNLFIFSLIILIFFAINISTYAKTNPDNLEAKIESVLSSYYPDEFNISVDSNGKVTINGSVSTLYDKLDVYDLVSRVKGVTAIDDFLIVNTPDLPDDEVKANIEEAIKDNSIILEPDKIKVHVSEGLVILTGTVSYHKEKLMAETVASWEDGVLGIDNQISVLPSKIKRSDENILSVLNEILKNDFPLMVGNVNIKVKDGIVTVNGVANSLWEKVNLPKDFLKVLGVKNVVENLKINTES